MNDFIGAPPTRALPYEQGRADADRNSPFLLQKDSLQPTFHMQCQHAVRPIKGDLPHFKAFPAKFGGSDETVDW